jgi:hypothetical protein
VGGLVAIDVLTQMARLRLDVLHPRFIPEHLGTVQCTREGVVGSLRESQAPRRIGVSQQRLVDLSGRSRHGGSAGEYSGQCDKRAQGGPG